MKNKSIIIVITVLSIMLTIFMGLSQNAEASNFLSSISNALVAFWPADGNANDVTGHSHNGVLSGGVTFGRGITAKAFFFNGVSGSVNVGSLGINDTNDPFSIVAWVKPTGTSINDNLAHTIVQEGSTPNNSGNGEFMINFDLNPTNHPGSVNLEIGATQTFSADKYTNTKLTGNKWTFVVATYDGSRTPNGMKIYFNGVEQPTTLIGSGFTGTEVPRDQWSIGAQGYASNNVDVFKGSIDDVKVFSRVLSNNEIKELFLGFDVIAGTIHVGNSPGAIGVNTHTNKIYVANQNDNTLSVINGFTKTVTNTIVVGSRPIGVGVNPQTNMIYVGDLSSNIVTVINGL